MVLFKAKRLREKSIGDESDMTGNKSSLTILPETDSLPEGNPYEPPMHPSGKPAASIEPVSYEEMPAALKRFMDEHKACLEVVREFDAALSSFKESNWQMSQEVQDAFRKFFMFFDRNISAHNSKEEKLLFPRLQRCFMDAGEYSSDERLMSAIDILEEDHLQIVQSATLVFNFLGLAPRLPNLESRIVVFEHAYEHGKELVEYLRLHIIREDETLFPLACKYMDDLEFEELNHAMEEYA